MPIGIAGGLTSGAITNGAPGQAGERGGSRVAAAAERLHNVARCAAEGAPLRDLARLAGLSEARTEALLARPAFAELVAHYRAAA